ncbi:MAG TPA: ATP-binding protein [Actinomycetota bacterium]|nr:ATP-binding protein [Actinomycetota bacterium]
MEAGWGPPGQRFRGVRKRFAGSADQVGAARRFVGGVLSRGSCASRAEETARLLVTEAATNALLHSASGDEGGSFEVRCQVDDDRRLRVEVHDAGAPTVPRRRVHQLDAVTGRGLDLFEALASRWGLSGGSRGRVVWFELDL